MDPVDKTIDITDLVEKARSTFVLWAVNAVLAYTVTLPGFQWVAFPFFSYIFQKFSNFILNFLSNTVVMEAFFMNTALRKASQAQDYLDAVTLKNNLPGNVSDVDYERAEQAEIAAFNAFVVVTN